MADFQTDDASVGGLFSGDSFYKVPNYQRPFSWDYDNFDDLIGDTSSAKRTENYFLGTIVLHRDGNGTKIIVDGQQRLTSLIILLACLRDSIESDKHKKELQDRIKQEEKVLDGIPERVRIEVKDREIFNRVVVTEGGTQNLPDRTGLTEPEARYLDACISFHGAIAKMTPDEKIGYVTFLNQKCKLIYLMADSFEEAFRLFQIVNDRGKQLRRIDVLKAINTSPDHVSQEGTRDKIASQWEEAEASVGETNFESIFFLLRLIYVKDKPQGDLLNEFEERIFGKSLIKPGEPFVDRLLEYVDLYRAIFIDKNYLEGLDQHLRFEALINIMDAEFKASEWRACLLFFAAKFGRDQFFQFVLLIEKVFLDHWVRSIRKDERYGDYTRLLNLIENSSKPENVVDETKIDDTAIRAAITGANVYGAGYAKYFLLRLELSVSEFEKPNLLSARSIEHVFPQEPKDGGAWHGLATAEERSGFVHKIGNLVLLSKSKNSSASNHEFSDKNSKYLASRISDYPRSVQVLTYDSWTPETIQERSVEAVDLILRDP
jgi:hypothetical protein